MTLSRSALEYPRQFAIYVAQSSTLGDDLGLPEQEQLCREAIARQGGQVVAVYHEVFRMGWCLERKVFHRLRADAASARFDAVMLWRYDRLARHPQNSAMIRLLMHHAYGVRMERVEPFSGDEAPLPAAPTALMTVCFDQFYESLPDRLTPSLQDVLVTCMQ
jgi:hypothetical protein